MRVLSESWGLLITYKTSKQWLTRLDHNYSFVCESSGHKLVGTCISETCRDTSDLYPCHQPIRLQYLVYNYHLICSYAILAVEYCILIGYSYKMLARHIIIVFASVIMIRVYFRGCFRPPPLNSGTRHLSPLERNPEINTDDYAHTLIFATSTNCAAQLCMSNSVISIILTSCKKDIATNRPSQINLCTYESSVRITTLTQLFNTT